MLCVEDALDSLRWAESIGGLGALIARSDANLKAIEDWVARSTWAAFLAEEESSRPSTSICLKIKDATFTSLPPNDQRMHAASIVSLLEKEGVAYDIRARDTKLKRDVAIKHVLGTGILRRASGRLG